MNIIKPVGKFTCSCGNIIGQIVLMEQAEVLQIGSCLGREFHGVCIQCGKGVHWSTPERILSRLIARSSIGRQTRWSMRELRDQMIVELKQSGSSWMEIARRNGCSVSTCKRVFRNLKN